jgi:hypothetical protein
VACERLHDHGRRVAGVALTLLSLSAVFDDVARCLSLFPWAAFLRFVEAAVLQLRIDASLRDVLPWNVCFGKLLHLRSLEPAFGPSRSADAAAFSGRAD